ncbi:MAG: thiamine phosphate synthase [Candidatus Omnitrophica bacterium]|nr:thiamine phosphate synthase [Candidatus Omnitrophota bacterium]
MKKKLSSNGLLYVIIDKQIVDSQNKNIIDLAKELTQSSADLIQLRVKKATDADFLDLAKRLTPLFKKVKKLLVVNDRADIAYLSQADGLHLGSRDIPIKEARRLLGPEKILGKTIHSVEELKETDQKKLDYLALGPFFESKTKENNRPPLRKREIKQIVTNSKKVIFAIGGINRYNINSVLKYNLKNVVVSSAIITSNNPNKKTKEIKKCLKKVS